MANVVQWGVDQLYAKLREIQQSAETERVNISRNNGKLVALNAQVQALPDSANKRAMLAWIAQSVQRQAQIVASWRNLSARFASLAGKVKTWLASVGINPSDSGLAGLGDLGLVWVPVTLVALAIAAWGACAYIHQRNQVQLKAIEFQETAFDQLVKQGANTSELQAFMESANKATQQLEPKNGDPLGLEALAGAIPWIVGGALLVMFGPDIMRALRSRRAAA